MRPTLALLALASLASCATREPDAEPSLDKPSTERSAPEGGAHAKREEGRVGGGPATADPRTVTRGEAAEAGPGVFGAGEAAPAGGTFTTKGEQGGSVVAGEPLTSEVTGGIGGLIGSSGTQVGAGGLGVHGTGVGGGGGSAVGIGGLGTRGTGSGSSGYGKGGGNFGSGAGTFDTKGRRPDPMAPLRDRVSDGEQYTDHGVNGHVLVEKDAQSTFSIDVDTASFAIARRYLDEGSLPPTAAVRVEEFINAQAYAYRPPGDEAPFAVNMEAAPDPFAAGHHVLRIGVKAAEPTIDRAPVHLTFLVDVSGSMQSQDKLPLAQRALHHLVDQLDGEDRVALVTYAGGTRVVLEPTRASQKSSIHAAIDQLRAGGGTGMESGMTLAYDLALRTLEPGTENRVIVLSDGDANIGATSHEQLLASLRDYAKQGITMSTIGFGRGNYKDTLMEQLANDGDGNYFYVDTFAEATKVFGTDLAGTTRTVARDVKIQVEFDPASVISYRLIGYENRDIADRDFRNDAVDAGEIGSGHTVTALYDLVLRDAPSDRLATVRMRSKPPGPDAPAIERSTTLPSSAIRAEFASATPDFRIAWTAATFAELLRGSPHVAELSWAQLAGVGRAARRNPQDDALLGLIATAGRLSTSAELAAR